MSGHPQMVFVVPSPTLGRVEDVFPERLTQDTNDWIAHTREILKKAKEHAGTRAMETKRSAALRMEGSFTDSSTARRRPSASNSRCICHRIQHPAR